MDGGGGRANGRGKRKSAWRGKEDKQMEGEGGNASGGRNEVGKGGEKVEGGGMPEETGER
jgi:hypothetical protein